MSLWLILAIGGITYLSRVLALAVTPRLPDRLQAVVDRIPPSIFAGLAAISLLNNRGGPASLPILAAAAGALLSAPFRSLFYTLVGGLLGYAAGTWAIPILLR
jgi:branched-subunit amino acid transport protein